jgi:hypothetical protein
VNGNLPPSDQEARNDRRDGARAYQHLGLALRFLARTVFPERPIAVSAFSRGHPTTFRSGSIVERPRTGLLKPLEGDLPNA